MRNVSTAASSVAFVLVLLAFAACAGREAVRGTAVVLQCGDEEVHAVFDDERVTMIVAGERFELHRVPTASGARYVALDDSTTSLWNKGDCAAVEVRGRSYPECWSATVDTTPAPSPATPATGPLQGPLWVVEDIDGRGIVDSSRITLNFEPDGRVSGRASCNSYSGGYTLDGFALRFTEMVTTKMGCPPAIMDQEGRFLEILQQVSGYELRAEGALVLRTPEGRTLTAFED